MKSQRVLVVGGGLAGMAAAISVASTGAAVTLLEARKSLGGRAGSFDEPQSGEELDNCQHVLLGCCTNLLDFYRRLGVLDHIRWENSIRFADGNGRVSSLGSSPLLPAPLHLSAAFLRFNVLNWREKIAATGAMVAMLRLGRAGRAKWANRSFGEWLDEHRQPASLLKKLYDPVLVGSLNEQCRDASAAYALEVFQDALLMNRRGFPLGLPAVPLRQLYSPFPGPGVNVETMLGARVNDICIENNRTTGVRLADGTFLPADAVILATNHHAVQRWTPSIPNLDRFESVPILGVHLWFDRPVLDGSHVAFLEGPLQWLFRKDETGAAVHGVISASREWVDVSKEESLRQFEAQVRSTFAAAREAKLLRGVIVIEKRATFSPRPGVDDIRPGQKTSIDGLFLAGDYTKTGWPGDDGRRGAWRIPRRGSGNSSTIPR